MKRTRITQYGLLAGIALYLAAGQIGAEAQTITPPPALISFQGRLAKPDGTPVTDGNAYAVTLSLWDAASSGTKRWEQTFTGVTVRNGVFAVLLNLNSGFTSGNNLDSTLNNNTYLQVQLGNNPALTPRQQLVSGAYALKAGTVPDGSISITKLDTNLKGSILGGAAGGDLTGSYPSPQIKTDSSLLNKVSGTLLFVSSATTAVDQAQATVTATVTSSAWQSFTPSTTGTLVEIDVNCGTTGAPISTTLSLYSGQGTNSTPLQTIPITMNSARGLQSFPITANVTAGQVYTWAIGSNDNLIFGYTGGSPYAGGRADLGQQFDYAFQTRMKVTTAPTTQINATANLFQTGSFYLSQNASVGPMLVKQYDPFTSGTNNAIGRSGLFQAASDILFGGMADASAGTRSIRFGTWSADGATRADILSILNSGNVGIGTTTPDTLLTVGGNARATGNLRVEGTGGLTLSGSGAGITFPDGSKQTVAAVGNGSAAGGDLTGTYPNPTIAAGKVDNTKLASDAASLNKVSGGALNSTGSLLGVPGYVPLEFGQGTGKSADAGKIGYGIFDGGVLDITGGGIAANGSDRQVKIYAEGGLTVNGSASLSGALSLNSAIFGPTVLPIYTSTVEAFSVASSGTTLQLANSSFGGNFWNLIATGSGNSEGTNKLVFNSSSGIGDALIVSGNTGEVNVPHFMSISGSTSAYLGTYSYLANKNPITGTSVGTSSYALIANSRIAASEFNAFSDVRLKRPIGRSDAFHDLNTLLGIEVTDYTLRDTIGQGDRVHKKVIAQQIETVYPQAVTRTTGAIPDIYQRAKVDHGWVQLATNLKAGERVKLLTAKGSSEVYKALDVTPQGFQVDLPNVDEVFVYGREVSDLRTVDYEAIAMLNVSATQAMYRQMNDLKARATESEASLTDLKAKNMTNEANLADMKAKNAAMEARLAAIETALNHPKTAQK